MCLFFLGRLRFQHVRSCLTKLRPPNQAERPSTSRATSYGHSSQVLGVFHAGELRNLESMHLTLEVESTQESPWRPPGQSEIVIARVKRLQTLARGPGLLERRVAPVPQGRMLFVEELEGVTAVGEKVTEELEAASLAE